MSRTRVLVAEDCAELRALYSLALQGLDLEVITAADGVEALAMARVTPPTMLVTDLDMPNCDGLRLARHLRESIAEVPILCITGADVGDSRIGELRALGATVCVKPPSMLWLRDEVLRMSVGAAPVTVPVELAGVEVARNRERSRTPRMQAEIWLAVFASVIGCAALVAIAASGRVVGAMDPFGSQILNRCLGIVAAVVIGGAYLHVNRQSRAGGYALWAGALVWWALILVLPSVDAVLLSVGALATMAAATALLPLPSRRSKSLGTA